MNKFAYFYANTLGTNDPKKEYFYEGEKILNKADEIKFEDDIGNTEYNTKFYLTNFRILIISNKYIFDNPLCFVKTHWVKKPMIMGTNYIYIEFITGINYKINLPNYINENLTSEEIASSNYRLPKYIMIKFRGKESNIDQSYNIFKIALNGKEWKNSYKKEEPKDESKSSVSNVSGLGLERTKNIINTQLNDQNQMIIGSFTDIESMKLNAKLMIDLAQQLKSKLSSSMKNDSALSEINQVLTSIGFVDPVTRETSGKSYFTDLANQIYDFFTNYFSKEEIGILSLIDAYCIYNRSRGISTISPADMKSALNYFPKTNTSIQVKKFKNEMIMLHTNEYSLENLLEKLSNYLSDEKDYVSLKDFSDLTTKKNQLLSKILIDEMLDEGLLALEESDLELRYYLNKILSYKQ